MIFKRAFAALAGLAALLAPLPAAQDQSIATSATAIADYVRAKDATGQPRAETYVLAEGRYFDGSTVDRSLERVPFTDLTKILAANLGKQNYFPTSELGAADLLIMVHWGTTTVFEDPMRDENFKALQKAMASNDRVALNMQLMIQEDARASTMDAINRNALLLGYARILDRERRELQPTQPEITMSNELNEERYFVILMAYDNRLRMEEKKSKLLWVTRLSVRSPGNNFVEAVPALAKVGADVFGKHLDDLVRVKSRLRRSSVKLGELEIIGPAPEKAPPAKTDK